MESPHTINRTLIMTSTAFHSNQMDLLILAGETTTSCGHWVRLEKPTDSGHCGQSDSASLHTHLSVIAPFFAPGGWG